MSAVKFFASVLLALFLSVTATRGFAQVQGTNENFHPEIGLTGKDVIWIPTPQTLVEKMLDMARVPLNKYVIDLEGHPLRELGTESRVVKAF